MGMFSGCYLVLCGNEIASHLYRHPQTLEGPWPLLEQGPLGCQGTLTNWLPERGDCQGIVSTASGMTDRRLEGVLRLGSLTQQRESTLCLEGRVFGLYSCYLDGMLNVWTRWNVQHEEKSHCEPWHPIKKDITREERNLKNKQKQKFLRYVI